MFTRNKKVVSILGMLLVAVMLVVAMNTSTNVMAKEAAATYEGKAPKYVFLFIGDGMSYPQISATEMYLGKKAGLSLVDGGGVEKLNFSKFPVAGSAQTYDSSSFIPDSASTATSLASGHKTLSGVINMDVNKQAEFTPITEKLAAKGYKIGIVSSVQLNHATPAAFYAKVPSRGMYYEIATQIPSTGFHYFGGGDFNKRTGSDKNQTDIHDVLTQNGYKVVNTKEEILKLDNKSDKVVAINPNLSVADGTSLPYEIDRKDGELSLADFVKKGIDVLENDKGFFMMVEGGKIDWAGHANEAATSIHETIAFADSVQVAVDFYNKHPEETLIVVTGDHETGGMTIGFAGTGYSTFFDKAEKVTTSGCEAFDTNVIDPYRESHTIYNARVSDLADSIKKGFGLLFPNDADAEKNPEMVLTNEEINRLEAALKQTMTPKDERNYTEEEKILYGSYEPLSVTISHIVNNKAGISFTSYSHTGLPAGVFAIGAGQELFNGFYDNTDIYKKMADIVDVK